MTAGEQITIPKNWAFVEMVGRRGGLTCNACGKTGFRTGWRPLVPTGPERYWREGETFYCEPCGDDVQKQDQLAAADKEASPRRARRKR
jgi:hypothetical protein